MEIAGSPIDKRNIGVGGRAIQMRANPQMRVHGAYGLQDVSVVAKLSAGPRSDLFDLGRDLRARGAVVLRFERALYRAGEQRGDFIQLGRALRANVHLGARVRGDGVDARSAFDDSEVVRRSRTAVARQALFGEGSDGARQRMDRIGEAVIAPTMPAGAANGDVETAAGESLRRNVIDIRAIQNQERLNPASGARLPAQIAHAAQVALAFLTHIGDENQIPEVIGECRETIESLARSRAAP